MSVGTAARATSQKVPTYLSATSWIKVRVSGDNGGTASITRSSGFGESTSASSTRSMTYASRKRPEKRTRTRAPGTAFSCHSLGTR